MANPSTAAARVIVDELVRSGVAHAVLSPGSRSAPLAMALFDADAAGSLTLHVRFDERSAGFVALGLAKVSRRPVPVITTSGTAVANLHPALLEAHHAGIPLIAITADRPATARGTGANQTTIQPGIFADAPRFAADLPTSVDDATVRALVTRATAAAMGTLSANPGPSHLNVQFAEPLVPEPGDTAIPPGRPGGAPWAVLESTASAPRPATRLPLGPRTVVVAGDDAGPAARLLAERANWPLLAEPTSGSRAGTTAIRTYRLLLTESGGRGVGEDSGLAGDIERIVMFGHPTLSRPVSRLLARTDLELVVVAGRPDWPDPTHNAAVVAGAVDVAGDDDLGWLSRWADVDGELSKSLDDLVGAEPGLTPLEVAAEVWRAVPPMGLLVVGSSNPIRDLDLMAVPPGPGGRRKIIANRGLSGIDGTVSTAIGAALEREAARSFALMGDLTFLHDANGLLLGPHEQRPDLTIIVVNDNGGRIFATLEQGAPTFAGSFERVFATPHDADLRALCAASATPYRMVDDRAELAGALAEPPSGIEVIEVPVDGSRRRDLDQRIRALAGH